MNKFKAGDRIYIPTRCGGAVATIVHISPNGFLQMGKCSVCLKDGHYLSPNEADICSLALDGIDPPEKKSKFDSIYFGGGDNQ